MRVTIIPSDGVVVVDGEARGPLELSGIDRSVHAVQWYGSWGEVEYADPDTKHVNRNEKIYDFSTYQSAVDAWKVYIEPNTVVDSIPVTEKV